jgi:hypothetical protein
MRAPAYNVAMKPQLVWRALIAGLLGTGCWVTDFTEATVCLDGAQCRELTYAEGDRIKISFATDFIGGCETQLSSSCTVKREGDLLTVTGSTQVVTRISLVGCHMMGMPTGTTCESEPLPAGSYRVVFEGKSIPVTIPGVAPSSCVSNDSMGGFDYPCPF